MTAQNDWPDPDTADVEAALNLAATLDHIKDPSNRERALRNLARAVLRLRSQVAALTAEHSGACDDMAVCGNCWTAGRIDAAASAEAQVAAVTRLADDLDREAAGTDEWRRLDRDDEALAMAGPMKARQLREDAKRIRAALDAPPDVTR